MSDEVKPVPATWPHGVLPWYIVDLQSHDPNVPVDCGDPRCLPHQRVEGLAAPVAAWLRAVADQIDPPKRPTRSMVPGAQGGPFVVLPPPTP